MTKKSLADIDRPYIWAIPIAIALIMLLAPTDVLSRFPELRELCDTLARQLPFLKNAPKESAFPEVVQLGTCLLFLGLWPQGALWLRHFWVNRHTAEERMQFAFGSPVKALIAVLGLIGLAVVFYFHPRLFTDDPGPTGLAIYNTRYLAAFMFGGGAYLLPATISLLLTLGYIGVKRLSSKE